MNTKIISPEEFLRQLKQQEIVWRGSNAEAESLEQGTMSIIKHTSSMRTVMGGSQKPMPKTTPPPELINHLIEIHAYPQEKLTPEIIAYAQDIFYQIYSRGSEKLLIDLFWKAVVLNPSIYLSEFSNEVKDLFLTSMSDFERFCFSYSASMYHSGYLDSFILEKTQEMNKNFILFLQSFPEELKKEYIFSLLSEKTYIGFPIYFYDLLKENKHPFQELIYDFLLKRSERYCENIFSFFNELTTEEKTKVIQIVLKIIMQINDILKYYLFKQSLGSFDFSSFIDELKQAAAEIKVAPYTLLYFVHIIKMPLVVQKLFWGIVGERPVLKWLLAQSKLQNYGADKFIMILHAENLIPKEMLVEYLGKLNSSLVERFEKNEALSSLEDFVFKHSDLYDFREKAHFMLQSQTLAQVLNKGQKKRIETQILSDRVKFDLLFHFYYENLYALKNLSPSQNKLVFNFIMKIFEIKGNGMPAEIMTIFKDPDLSFFEIIDDLMLFYSLGNSVYDSLYFKTFLELTDLKSRMDLVRGISIVKTQILEGQKIKEIQYDSKALEDILVIATLQAIPAKSSFLSIQQAKQILLHSFQKDSFLRSHLQQIMPEIIHPETEMSFSLSKPLPKITRTKSRDYALTNLTEFLNHSHYKKASFAKIMGVENSQKFSEAYLSFVRKTDAGFLGGLSLLESDDHFVLLNKIKDYINDNVKDLINSALQNYQKAHAPVLIESKFNDLKNRLGLKHLDNPEELFLAMHHVVWEKILEEIDYALNSYENKPSDPMPVEYQMGKNAFLSVCGGLADICIAKEYALFERPDFNVLSIKNDQYYLGFIMLYDIIEDNQKKLIVGGIEPSADLMQWVEPEIITEQIFEVLREFIVKTDYDVLGLLEVSDISNRQNLNSYLHKKIMPRLTLKKFSGLFHRVATHSENGGQKYFEIWVNPLISANLGAAHSNN